MGSDEQNADSPSNAQRASNLARIRNNQRRSRARRAEYIAELEAKNASCEALGVAASAEMQAAARRVVEENHHLRALLEQAGVAQGLDAPLPSRAVQELEGLLTTRRECSAAGNVQSLQTGSAPKLVPRPSSVPSSVARRSATGIVIPSATAQLRQAPSSAPLAPQRTLEAPQPSGSQVFDMSLFDGFNELYDSLDETYAWDEPGSAVSEQAEAQGQVLRALLPKPDDSSSYNSPKSYAP